MDLLALFLSQGLQPRYFYPGVTAIPVAIKNHPVICCCLLLDKVAGSYVCSCISLPDSYGIQSCLVHFSPTGCSSWLPRMIKSVSMYHDKFAIPFVGWVIISQSRL